jgi:hypothetical protein
MFTTQPTTIVTMDIRITNITIVILVNLPSILLV